MFAMASPISAKKLLMVGALVVMAAMLAAHPAEASSFVFFSGPCSGNVAELNACGCNTVPSNTKGAYRFTFTGQRAVAYNQDGCTGASSTKFENGPAGQCSGLGWRSVFILC